MVPAPMSMTRVSLSRFMPYAMVNGSDTTRHASNVWAAASRITFLFPTVAREGAPITP